MYTMCTMYTNKTIIQSIKKLKHKEMYAPRQHRAVTARPKQVYHRKEQATKHYSLFLLVQLNSMSETRNGQNMV